MDETTETAGHRAHLRDKLLAREGSWFMGRFAPRELLEGVGRYLRLQTPERRDELLDVIRTRAEEIAEADQDLPVDAQSMGMLALTSTVLAAYETLLPLFDNDERRTILFLQHVVGAVARRPFEIAFETLGNRAHPLNAIEAACRKEGPLYGSYYDIAFDRLDTGTFEMRVHRCFFRDHFVRHDNLPLTTVMCAWDANWMQAVDPTASGLRAERPSLMSLGDDACRFRVVATDDPLATYSDKLQQQQTGYACLGYSRHRRRERRRSISRRRQRGLRRPAKVDELGRRGERCWLRDSEIETARQNGHREGGSWASTSAGRAPGTLTHEGVGGRGGVSRRGPGRGSGCRAPVVRFAGVDRTGRREHPSSL